MNQNKKNDIASVAKCLDHATLIQYVREVNDPLLAEKIKSLQHYSRDSLSGLQAHLNMLIHSELGTFTSLVSEGC